MRTGIAITLAIALGACSGVTTGPDQSTTASATVRIVLAGDVMLSRGVATVISADEQSVFAGIRHVIAGADIAAANLESPLTTRPHTSANQYELEADPGTARLLAATGFDLMSLPNNHSGDAGPAGLLDTIAALDDAGVGHLGAGPDARTAAQPVVLEVSGITIGFLAFDATGIGPAAGTEPGIVGWDDEAGPQAVARLRDEVDVVIVSVHGGAEYLPTTDPGMATIARTLTGSGADVVWGHGAHVVQPVTATRGDRPTIVATSLGNLLFDQFGLERTTGYVLEVMVDAHGVIAYRVGIAEHPDRRVGFVGWLAPEQEAAWMVGSWWSLLRATHASPTTAMTLDSFRHGELVAASAGDVDRDGDDEVVASFRRPYQPTTFMEAHPEVQWSDAQGLSAHLGVYEPAGLGEVWVAGSVLMPIASLEVCDGSLALVHDQLDDREPIVTSAWTWNGFGFDTAPSLPGDGTPACADIDGDGATDPIILDRG